MEEQKIIKIIEKTIPAVVSIVITEHLKSIEKNIYPEIIPFIPKNKNGKLKIPKNLNDKKNKNFEINSGSGFIVDSSGLILTNKHIVAHNNKTEYTVITNKNQKYTAQVLSRDPINDVAILKIDAKNLPTIPLGDSSKIKLGQTVLTIGNALGIFKNTVSRGIISGLYRSIYATGDNILESQELHGLIQTDAAINPGNSGGPLINLSGKVIGINSAMVSGAENIGFAIPINTAKKDLEDIKKYGKIKKPFLGIRYLTINDEVQNKFKLPFNYGALIISNHFLPAIIQNSPAQKAGLKEKDIILECNGKKINQNYTILNILEEKNIGDKINFLIWRSGKFLNFT
ncbi:MAG: trypsin-like peptidase domain-containing protein, partial [Patescibacteria group bacterium]|nr:trypsin-like peptidase domain-containing protein [Patescibacteria group bacterium]